MNKIFGEMLAFAFAHLDQIGQRRMQSSIKGWPDVVREKDAGVPVQALARRWEVSPITIWHTIQKARQQGACAGSA